MSDATKPQRSFPVEKSTNAPQRIQLRRTKGYRNDPHMHTYRAERVDEMAREYGRSE